MRVGLTPVVPDIGSGFRHPEGACPHRRETRRMTTLSLEYFR